jgi:hypothetical protein
MRSKVTVLLGVIAIAGSYHVSSVASATRRRRSTCW